MDRGYTPKQFISVFDACNADTPVERFSISNLGPKYRVAAGVDAAAAAYKR